MSRMTWVETDPYFPDHISIAHGTPENRSSLSVPLADVPDLITALAAALPHLTAPSATREDVDQPALARFLRLTGAPSLPYMSEGPDDPHAVAARLLAHYTITEKENDR